MTENVPEPNIDNYEFEYHCLIAYFRPHKNRRFDIVNQSDIICTKCAISWEPGWCYLKNTCPPVKCIVLLMDDPSFLNANFHQLTEHYTIAGYYKSEHFPNVDVDTSPPLGDVDINRIVYDLNDCFCSGPCKHDSSPLLKYENDNYLEPKVKDITRDMIENLEHILEVIINELAVQQTQAEIRNASELNDYLKMSLTRMIFQLENIAESLNQSDKNFYYYAKTVIQYYYSEAKVNILKLILKLRLMELDAKTDVAEPTAVSSAEAEGDSRDIEKKIEQNELPASSSTQDDEFDTCGTNDESNNISNTESDEVSTSDKVPDNNGEIKDITNIKIDRQYEDSHLVTDISFVHDENRNETGEARQLATEQPVLIELSASKRRCVTLRKLRPESESSYDAEEDDDEYDDDDEEEENDLMTIGESGLTKIPKSLYHTFKNKKYTAITRSLLKQLFTRDTLATSSMTGKMSPAFLNTDKKPRKQLNPRIVQDIVKFVTKHCNVLPSNVRTVITTKCADEYKMKKQREMKNTNSRKYSE